MPDGCACTIAYPALPVCNSFACPAAVSIAAAAIRWLVLGDAAIGPFIRAQRPRLSTRQQWGRSEIFRQQGQLAAAIRWLVLGDAAIGRVQPPCEACQGVVLDRPLASKVSPASPLATP